MAGMPPIAAQVQAPPQDSAYYSALQTALQPGFNTQANALAQQEAAMGVVNSGQGVNDFGQLAQDQNAIYAQQAAPMISQGFQNQFSANSQNAAAQNSLQQLLQNQSYGAGINNANNALQAQEFNSGQNYGLLSQDLGYQNALQLAQLGYGNSDYLAQLQGITGLEGTGLGTQGNILTSGMNNSFNGYQTGAQTGYNAGQATGYNAGYGSTGYTNPYNYGVNGGQSTGVDTTAPWSNGNGNDGYYGTGGG